MTKALIVGDVHLSDAPPSVRTETYAEDVLAKLRFARQQAIDHSVDVLVQAGDVFHSKIPGRTSHRLVQAAWSALTDGGHSPVPVLIVPGNHDLSNDRWESLPQQPLGALLKMRGVDLLCEFHADFPWLYGVPYLQNWQDLPEWFANYSHSAEHLVIAHAPIFPAGQEPPYEFIAAADWAALQGAGSCYYGHLHFSQGIYDAGEVTFCNHGAISRGSLHEETLKRTPQITLWEDGQFTPIEVPCKPAGEVFKLDEKEAQDQAQGQLDEFLASVEATTLDGLSLEEVVAKAEGMDLKPLTLQVVKESIDHALAQRG